MQVKIEAILFDKDGTLFDFGRSWGGWTSGFIAALARDTGLPAEAIAACLRFDLADGQFAPDSPVIAGTSEDIAAHLVAGFPGLSAARVTARMDAEAPQARMVPVCDLAALFSELRFRGLALGVATNAGAAEAQAHLADAGLAETFDFVAGYDSGHGSKPAPGMCRAFSEALDVDPGVVAMVGDSLHDLHAGRAAGMRTVAVLTGLAEAAALAPHADVVLPDIGHLPAWLDGLAGDARVARKETTLGGSKAT